MIRIFIYLLCFYSFFTTIHAIEDDGYDLSQIEEDNLDDYEEEGDENEAYYFPAFAHAIFKPAAGKDLDTNNALATLESGPSAIIAGCVNAITGNFFDSTTPLTIPGAMPLAVQCSYCSSEKKWRFHHMPKLRVGYSNGENHLRANYLDDNGSGMAFGVRSHEKYANHGLRGDLTVPESVFKNGLTNCGSGEISGKTNWRNACLSLVERKRKTKVRSYSLNHGSNIKRIFSRYKRFGKKKEAPTGKFRLTSEQHPNGNTKLYSYNKRELRQINTFSRENRQLGYLQVYYNPNLQQTSWYGDSGNATFTFKDKHKKLIKELHSSSDIPLSFSYNNGLLYEKKFPEGRFLKIGYYGNEKQRVLSLTNPIGTTHIFRYRPGFTEVTDGEGHITQYHYDSESKRLQRVARFDKHKKLQVQDQFEWSDQKTTAGNLTSRTFKEGEKILFKRVLGYDDFGNVTHDTLYGNLTGKSPPFSLNKFGIIDPFVERFAKTSIYSTDGCNLLLQENEEGKSTLYFYSPKTQLLVQRFTVSNHKILKREFFEYDDCGVLIKEIWDDGQTHQLEDLSNITERHVRLITPRTQAPIGLPEVIEEHYLDPHSEQYILLKKIVNHHSLQGKLLQEDHYGSDGNFAYSLSWEYDHLGNITKKVDALNHTTLYRYDGNSNKIYEEGPLPGWHKQYTYDCGNRLCVEKEYWPDGNVLITTHEYNLLNQRIKTIDAQDQETIFTYDALGRVIKTQGPGLFIGPSATVIPFEETKYDAMGNPIEQKDANRHLTKSSYTIRGKPYRIEHPDGTVEQKEYSLSGLPVKEVARSGLITEYTHDAFNRITGTTIKDSSGKILKIKTATYSTFQLLAETDEEGLETIYSYDGAGRRCEMKKGDHLTKYQYDALGRMNKIIESIDDKEERITCKTFDFLDRVIEEQIEDSSGQILKKERYTYDEKGHRTSVAIFTEAGKAISKTEYNPHGKPTLVTDALGNQTHYTYDHHFFYKGQIVTAVTATDPYGNRETKVYDTHGNVCWQAKADPFGCVFQEELSYYDPLGQKTHSRTVVYQGHEEKRKIDTCWAYNSMGNITCCVEADGTPEQKIVRHQYNEFGQKAITTMPNGISILHTYDSLGRLASYRSTDNTIHYQYSYNKKDLPILIEDLIHQTATKLLYDVYGHIQSETLDSGLNLTYTYDHLSRPLTVTLPDQSSIHYQYNAHHLKTVERIKHGEIAYKHCYVDYDLAGNVLEESLFENAGTIHYKYDLLQRPISVQAPHWQEMIPQNGFDPLGNLLTREVKDKQGALTYSYTYDILNQLISEEGFESHHYRNDSAYNRIDKDGDLYEVNALNQLQSQANTQYNYDRNGNLIEKITDGKKIEYIYDALDRLIEVRNGQDVTNYIYDSFHRRLSKTHNGKTSLYLYHNQNEIGQVVDGKVEQLRVLGLAYGAEIGGAVALELNGETYAPIHDPQGNVVALVDCSGQLVENYRYTAFGEIEVFSSRVIDNPWRFSSKRFDAETGFVYFGRRYYDPEIGRWTTPDPAGYADGPNLYAYVHNHPLAYIDPDGQLAFFLVPIVLSMAADYLLPMAVASIQPYTGVVVGSFLTGLVKGYTCDYSFSDVDPGSSLYAGLGVTIGTMLNFNPKGAFKAGSAATKALCRIAEKEALETVANIAQKNMAKHVTWYKPFNPLSQATQKSALAAEKCFLKGEKTRLTKDLPNKIENFLGKNPILNRPEKGSDLILRSKDGFKQIRFDLRDPHGLDPHINIETFKPRNLYPGDLRMTQVENIHVFPRKI